MSNYLTFTIAQVEGHLKRHVRCSSCGSHSLEAFSQEGEDNKTAIVGTVPDQKLDRYIPVVPFVCTDCGIMGSIWAHKLNEMLKSDG